MASLQRRLENTHIDQITRSAIIHELWPNSPHSPTKEYDWDSYFLYYLKQCHHALHDQGKHLLARTHQHILDIKHLLEEHTPKEDIKSRLRPLFATSKQADQDEILNNTIDLAVRLYLMVNVGTSKYAITRETQLTWAHGDLETLLTKHFNEPQVLGNANIRLDRAFTAYNLNRIAGIKVQWTDNLADHLRMIDDEDKIVAVFHHVSLLKRQNR